MKGFKGFSPQTIDFLWEIRMNNNKEWMDQNRDRYKEVLKEPFDRLAFSLSEELNERTGEDLDWAISRINRDIRYSKDKSPYRSCRWVVFKEPMAVGTTWKTRPVFYFELTPEGYTHGMGFYETTPTYMKAFRKKVEANASSFLNIVNDLEKKSRFALIGDDYKRVDATGVDEEIRPWYIKKNFAVVETKGMEDILFTEKLPQMLAKEWKVLIPLYQYLRGIKID
ncbi:DUF2461 domain-containing protein [Anaerotignum sp.]|uniref:DUF2461 domain-containing protein n=1 Tax=Anaerotignum sp. TaxID=2039241 RepID=UPI0028A78498|nr:DUF2461 domain-containing protein [Anaerotignum sp.]